MPAWGRGSASRDRAGVASVTPRAYDTRSGSSNPRSAPYELGEPEREVERLARVQPRVAARLVLVLELLAAYVVAASEAFGDVVAGQFDMDCARPYVGRATRQKKLLDFVHDRVEVTGLVAALMRVGVAVHRIARPDDRMTGPGHGPQQWRQLL